MPDTLIFVLFFIIVAIAWLFGTYNKFIKYKNLIQEAWSGIDVALKQRANLVPNLVRTVKGYGNYESKTLESVTEQRTDPDNMESRSSQENEISASLNNLLALAESYPDLKANHNFIELQKNLTETEQQVLTARQQYNSAVRKYNTHVESVPSNIMARIFDFTQAEYFQIGLATQRALPEVDL